MSRLTIADRRERSLVAAADVMLSPLALRRLLRGGHASEPPARILALRLERIGDLLMILPALADLRALAPDASIDLVVGSWNREIASSVAGIHRVETLDAAWLARGAGGAGVLTLARAASAWRSRRYDLAVNFEPDIRSNIVAAAAGARRTVGFRSGGGGALLNLALDYDAGAHTTDNARALVRRALGGSPEGRVTSSLDIPDANRVEAAERLRAFDGLLRIGMHVSAGRAIKQWPEMRFRDVAEALVRRHDAGIVLTGAPEDRPFVEVVRAALPPGRVINLSADISLLTLAAVLAKLDLFVTGDSGPMHLAHALGTPIVAVFGPSDPRRYAPRGLRDEVVRIDLPCSPCNRIRTHPPARCVGHTPDCLAGVEVAQVLAAIDTVLDGARR